MAQDPSSDQEASEPHANYPQDPVARWWKQPVDTPRARVYPAREERPRPPWVLGISFILWLVAALPVAILMAVNGAQLIARAGASPTFEIVFGTVLYFAILSVFPFKLLSGRQWARVWLLVVCALWTLLWLPRLLDGSLIAAPTDARPFTLGLFILIGFLLSTPADDPAVWLGVAILFSTIVVIMICASILMFQRPSNEFFREIRTARRQRRAKPTRPQGTGQ